MKVKIKKLHPDAVIPKYAKNGDAGMDIVAIKIERDPIGNHVYSTGLAFEIPKGYFMMLLPRSSNANKDLILTNHCGIVDSGFRGEVKFKYREYFVKEDEQPYLYEIGDRIGQLIIMPYPQIEFEEVKELSETERGSGGYGSTGK